MRTKSFKIFALSMAFMFLSASSVYAGNYMKKCNSAKVYNTFKKAPKPVPKTKNPKVKPVKKIGVTEITLNKTKTTIAVGSWERLVAVVKPGNAQNKHVLWYSTRPDIATVNPSGKVTGIRSGEAVIYAVSRFDFSKMASCTVTVGKGKKDSSSEVTGIYLNKTTTTLNVGSSETLTATVVPASASSSVTWYSGSPNTVSVNQSGRITAKRTGTARIFAVTSGGRYADSCLVTVVSDDTSVTSVNLNTTSVTLRPGSTKTLVATVKPENAADKSLTWTSSDTSVAVVNRSGRVTAISEGTAVITVRTNEGDKTDQCVIRVVSEDDWDAVTEVKINLLHIIIPVGEKDTLRYSIEPSDADNQEVVWTSSNTNVVSVTSTGVVEAKRAGTANVTATSRDGSKKATCTVTVVPAAEKPANGILFNKISSTLLVGMSDYPTVIAYPAGTSTSSLSWSTSDSSVATVTQSGKVTAIAAGNAVITVRTSDNKTASYFVVVTQ